MMDRTERPVLEHRSTHPPPTARERCGARAISSTGRTETRLPGLGCIFFRRADGLARMSIQRPGVWLRHLGVPHALRDKFIAPRAQKRWARVMRVLHRRASAVADVLRIHIHVAPGPCMGVASIRNVRVLLVSFAVVATTNALGLLWAAGAKVGPRPLSQRMPLHAHALLAAQSFGPFVG